MILRHVLKRRLATSAPSTTNQRYRPATARRAQPVESAASDIGFSLRSAALSGAGLMQAANLRPLARSSGEISPVRPPLLTYQPAQPLWVVLGLAELEPIGKRLRGAILRQDIEALASPPTHRVDRYIWSDSWSGGGPSPRLPGEWRRAQSSAARCSASGLRLAAVDWPRRNGPPPNVTPALCRRLCRLCAAGRPVGGYAWSRWAFSPPPSSLLDRSPGPALRLPSPSDAALLVALIAMRAALRACLSVYFGLVAPEA